MKIVVDADACPAKNIIVSCAKKNSLPVIMVSDSAHYLEDGYSTVITVDRGADSADFKIIVTAEKGDIVITQDYGVASMALGKKCFALRPDGFIYTDFNIDSLLMGRHIAKKVRNSGGKLSNPKKRTKEDDQNFENSLKNLIAKAIAANF